MTVAAPEKPPVPTLRLPAGPVPTGYTVELMLDPALPTFAGTVDIGLSLPTATSFLWLNGKGITVDTAEIVSGADRVPATATTGGQSYVGFTFPRPMSGAATLHVVYKGQIDRNGSGIYVQHSGEDAYLFTQFENTDARRMVPCFDEPAYKVPWQLTLHVPSGMPAFSNTGVVADVDDSDGRHHKVTFAPTPPLPSYLLALVVGPMEIVDAGTAGAKKTPLRILVPRGRAGQAAYTAGIVAELLRRLEDAFGIPFPYEKLDNAARPEGLGAMENAGLIISGAGYLIAEPELQSVAFRRRTASVAAHEMAHQWFGDLVTMSWWDDVWLNEAFASWMGDKVFAVEKDWDAAEDRANARRLAMEADMRTHARQIRQPIESVDDIDNAFDAITYQKGETVLAMFERALGADVFRAGVKKYLETHAFKNATTTDFVAAISAAAGRDVAPSFASFLDQPGLPAVNAEVKCSVGGKARILLTQERYVAAGAATVAAETWRIPVCVQVHSRLGSRVECRELDGPTGEIALDECPGWMVANAGGTGYYLARYTPDGLRALAAHVGDLTVAERLGLLTDVRIQLVGGTQTVAPALDLVARLARVGPAAVTGQAAAVAEALVNEGVVGPEQGVAYAVWVQRVFGARARAYGLKGRPADRSQKAETADDKAARAEIVPLVAIHGKDRALTEEARALALRWLDDRKALDADSAGPVLRIAAATGDVAFADRLRAAAARSVGYDRTVLVGALFQMLDPDALTRAAGVLGTDELKPRELRFIAARNVSGAARPVIFHAVREHYDALAARTGERGAALLGSGALRESGRSASGIRAPRLRGGPRTYALNVERIQTCIAVRKTAEAGLAAALKRGR